MSSGHSVIVISKCRRSYCALQNDLTYPERKLI